jgi:hypothetical protein
MVWTLLIALFIFLVVTVLVMLAPDIDVKIKRFIGSDKIHTAPKSPKLLDRYKILKRENK